MNYQNCYNRIIQNSVSRDNVVGIFEIHHIIPRSMGGSNDPSNLVKLTPREHYIVHHLLWKIHKNSEMSCAFWAMSQMTKGSKISSKTYEKLRTDRIEFLRTQNTGKRLSEETKKKIGEKSKGRTHSEETKKKISDALIGKTVSEFTKEKIREANLGKKYSDETCKKISDGQKGRLSPRKGVTLSEETKKKISETKKSRKSIVDF